MNGGSESPPTLGIDQVDERLVVAIQDGRLRPVLRELGEVPSRLDQPAQTRIAEASRALAAIDCAVESEGRRLAHSLIAKGVGVSSPPGERPDRPLRVVTLEVAPRDVDPAAVALEAAGYRRCGPTHDAAWRSFRATRGGCTFVGVDRLPFRVELSWPRPRAARGLLGRLLAPHGTDFETVSLPAWLWPAYTLVHLLRLPIRRLRRHRDPPDLGPFLETPDALIEPLLRFAGLGKGDVLVDLGCGDGRIPITAAKIFGCRARGLETDTGLVARARAAAASAGVGDRVEILCADASEAPLDDAGVVVAFLPVATVEKLLPSILDRMPAGARLVVHEQNRLRAAPADARVPLFSTEGISVAHRWNRRTH
jgi:Methyltransferase domain